MVLLKVAHWKSVIRFRKWGKLGPRFIGPFGGVARIGKVVYRVDLLEELSHIHNTFHVSQLQKFLVDDSIVVPLDNIQVDACLNYIERMVVFWIRRHRRCTTRWCP